MKELNGKKLLLLGGIAHAMEIVQAAQEMGIEVHVTDYYETSPAKRMADKAHTVSTIDINALEELCKKEKIDGIVTGFIDSMLPFCEKICRKMDMPFWGTQEQIEICIDKKLFKDTCKEYGVPVVEEYHLEHNEEGLLKNEEVERIKYPVIVKPVDNSGSRGVYICQNELELIENYKNALSYSKKKEILVEQYITGQHVNMYYTLCDGEVYLSAMADRYVDYLDGKSAPLPVCLVHPSQYLTAYETTVDMKVRNMFKGMGMKNGVAFVQGFHCEDGDFTIYEMGYRLNGGGTYSLIKACTGYDQLKSLIHFSITGSMGNKEVLQTSTPYFEKMALNYVLSVQGGNIGKIEGLDYIRNMENVVNVIQVRFEGDQVQGKGGSAQVIAYVLFLADNMEHLEHTLSDIYEHVVVTDEEENRLNVVPFDISSIDHISIIN